MWFHTFGVRACPVEFNATFVPVPKYSFPPGAIPSMNDNDERLLPLERNICSVETEEGLIHISELDWKMVRNPADVAKAGEIVDAQIVNINDDGRIFLSLKALKERPVRATKPKAKAEASEETASKE